MSEPTNEQLQALWNICKDYVEEQQISCSECVYQSDRVILGAYEFIEDICDTVGYWQPGPDD